MSEAAKNRRSFSMAYLLAQCAPPLKLPDKQPTAYSYNGVVLPKLPEWDKTVYPYAFLYSIFPTKYGFVVSDTIPYRKDGKIYVGNAMATMVSGDMEVFPIPTAGNELVRESYGNAIWTKPPHDILNEDGTIYLAASEPVPVYE